MPYVQFDDISVHESGGLAFTVSFWIDQSAFDAGSSPLVTNDFVMPNLRKTRRAITTRESDGFIRRSDDTWVDPDTLSPGEWDDNTWSYTDYPVDIGTVMRQAARRFAGRFQSWTTNKKAAYSGQDPRIRRKIDAEDTHGVLDDIKSLRGTRESV